MKIHNIIIGIGGVKGSGKDTVASMINYIVNTTPEDCTYNKYVKNKNVSDAYFDIHIIHFAEVLKFVVSKIYNIPIKLFNSRKYKDDYWYFIKDNIWYAEGNIPSNYTKITIEDLAKYPLSYYLNSYNDQCVIKIRTLLQYFGTNICREYLSNNIWINNCIKRAIDINEKYGYCIIPDVRFQDEADTIRNINDCTKVIIVVNRDTKNLDNHESEQVPFNTDYIIENNSSLGDLFKQCKSIIKIIEDEIN